MVYDGIIWHGEGGEEFGGVAVSAPFVAGEDFDGVAFGGEGFVGGGEEIEVDFALDAFGEAEEIFAVEAGVAIYDVEVVVGGDAVDGPGFGGDEAGGCGELEGEICEGMGGGVADFDFANDRDGVLVAGEVYLGGEADYELGGWVVWAGLGVYWGVAGKWVVACHCRCLHCGSFACGVSQIIVMGWCGLGLNVFVWVGEGVGVVRVFLTGAGLVFLFSR